MFVEPETYLTGYTTANFEEIERYLVDTDNTDFLDSIEAAREKGIAPGEILCSMYAKLCYKALTLGKNPNITRTRDISSNIQGCFDQGHGSIFEHCNINFLTTNCSRVLTHELVRHRVGLAFSQTSGRYVRPQKNNDGDYDIDLILDPILDPVAGEIEEVLAYLGKKYAKMSDKLGLEEAGDFTKKKKMTSALRRILPNGQANEIGWTANIRSLRHMIMMRTNRHAEWEIRKVFSQVYSITQKTFPLIFHGAKEEVVDGLLEITGMKMQPYESVAG